MNVENENRKRLILMILNILQDYSDEQHPLTQEDIIHHLKMIYDTTCDRRTIASNIRMLNDMDYEILHAKDGYYLANPTFEAAELRLLIDGVLCSQTISEKQSRELIEKLRGMGNTYFEAKVSHVCCNREMPHLDSKQLLYTIDKIHDAINDGKQIAFTYNAYGTDLKLHPKRDRKYVVNTYQIVVNVSKYYLVGNYDKYDDVSHYRLDLMTDVEVLDARVKPMKQVKGLEQGLRLGEHMREHIYMYGGESSRVTFHAKKSCMTEYIDWLGTDIRVISEDDEFVMISAKCNENAAFYWALQYGADLEVVAPERLRQRVYDMICDMKHRYEMAGREEGNPNE